MGHSATRLRHAEVPRGEAVPRSPRHQRAGDRQRVLVDQGRGEAVQQRQAGRLRRQRQAVARRSRNTPPGPTRARSSARSWPPSSWPCSRGWASPPATWAASTRPTASARSSNWPRATAPTIGSEFIKEIQFSQPDEFFFFEHDLHGPERRRPRSAASISIRCSIRRSRRK